MAAPQVVNNETLMHQYWNQLPDKMFSTIGQSFLYTLTACMISCNWKTQSYETVWTVSRPLIAATVAAAASTIHALSVPLFDRIFVNGGNFITHQEFVKACFVITAVYLLVTHLAVLKAHVFVLNIFGLVPINLISNAALLPATFLDWLGKMSVGKDSLGGSYRHLCEYFGLNINQKQNSIYFMFV